MALRIARLSLPLHSLPLPRSSLYRVRQFQSALVVSLPPTTTATTRTTQTRTMASSSLPKTEWLIVVPDKPGTLAKRLEVRPTHFANLKPHLDAGIMKFGGAVLDDAPSDPDDPKTFAFAGSSLILLAETKAEAIEFIKKDIYAEVGVWDVDNAHIWALKTAFRLP